MRAGRLDKRVTIRSRGDTRDEYGAAVPTWPTLAEVWAQRLQQTGREFLAGDKDTAERGVVWRIRWRDDIDETMRVSFEGQEYDIVEVRELGRKAGLELHTTAVVEL